eukprot:CAMPEP_0115831664 /NCGR_PEP_ID=MMETSP0287-20121206/2255_1 /TAXON_ID=412157 /ORGANISM="Chrysochromulina rotalis, Strain UIO044" /LENGTH=112 /DNA_ID=CAMNT_0003285017 /DNA_START=1 /DNA_END=339 /DNA_ORIENTATION=-
MRRYNSYKEAHAEENEAPTSQVREQPEENDAHKYNVRASPPACVQKYDSSQHLDKAFSMMSEGSEGKPRVHEGAPPASENMTATESPRLIPPALYKYDSSQHLDKALSSGGR